MFWKCQVKIEHRRCLLLYFKERELREAEEIVKKGKKSNCHTLLTKKQTKTIRITNAHGSVCCRLGRGLSPLGWNETHARNN